MCAVPNMAVFWSILTSCGFLDSLQAALHRDTVSELLIAQGDDSNRLAVGSVGGQRIGTREINGLC